MAAVNHRICEFERSIARAVKVDGGEQSKAWTSSTTASQTRRVCKIALRGPTACATAGRDFAHAVGREPRGCTPYTAFMMQWCWELLPSVSQRRIKLNPDIIDARMTLMAIRAGFIGKRARRCQRLGPI